jgi:hypothetical protein
MVDQTMKRLSVKWAWYDLWVGFFWEQHSRRLFWCPVPTVAVVLNLDFRKDWK